MRRRSASAVAVVAVALAVTACSRPGGTAEGPVPRTELGGVVEQALARFVPSTGGRFVAAVALIDPVDGDLLAYAASEPDVPDLLDVQRPSGSTLKLAVDVAAALAGVRADDLVIGGRNCVFPDGVDAPDDVMRPFFTVREASGLSVNCAFGKLVRVLGPQRMGATVAALGFERDLDLGTDFAFGANTASMRELAIMTATIVNGGHRVGEPGARVLPDEVVSAVAEMTSSVLTEGTAAGHALTDRWAIAKTGTSLNSTDAWIVGGTPELVAVVWMGNPADPGDGMIRGAVPGFEAVHGGDLPAAVWEAVLEAAHADRPGSVLETPSVGRDPVLVVDPTTDCGVTPDVVGQPTAQIAVPWVAAEIGQASC